MSQTPEFEFIINQPKYQIDKIVPRRDLYFSTRLPNAKKTGKFTILWLILHITQHKTRL